MKKDKLPVSSEHLLDQILSYGRRAPEGLEALPIHVFIRMVRHALRMTQTQLAKRAGLPQSHLAVIETGKVDLKLATLRKIFRAAQGDLVIVVRFRKTPASLVAERIREVARKKIARVAGSMALEKQLPDDAMTQRLIKAEEERMLREPSTEIWEDLSLRLDWGGAMHERAQMSVRVLEQGDDRADLRYWSDRSPAERVDAVEFLREQYYALSGHKTLPRLAHAVQVMDRPG